MMLLVIQIVVAVGIIRNTSGGTTVMSFTVITYAIISLMGSPGQAWLLLVSRGITNKKPHIIQLVAVGKTGRGAGGHWVKSGD